METPPLKTVYVNSLNFTSTYWKEGLSEEEQTDILDSFPYLSVPVQVVLDKKLNDIIVTGKNIEIPGLEERRQCYTPAALLETKKRFERSKFVKKIDTQIKEAQEKMLTETIRKTRLEKGIVPFYKKRMQACEHRFSEFDQCLSEFNKAKEKYATAQAATDYAAVEVMRLKELIAGLEHSKVALLAYVRKFGFQDSRLN